MFRNTSGVPVTVFSMLVMTNSIPLPSALSGGLLLLLD
jgi:hypothetical protein